MNITCGADKHYACTARHWNKAIHWLIATFIPYLLIKHVLKLSSLFLNAFVRSVPTVSGCIVLHAARMYSLLLRNNNWKKKTNPSDTTYGWWVSECTRVAWNNVVCSALHNTHADTILHVEIDFHWKIQLHLLFRLSGKGWARL